MVNHGLTTAALFILVGMLDERCHTRKLSDFGGIWKSMPVFSGFFLLFGMASLGLPGLNNFVSEIIILLGVFRTQPVIGALAFAAIVPTLIYVLKPIQEILFGPARAEHRLRDLSGREMTILTVLAVAVITIGIYPMPVLTLLQSPIQRLLEHTGPQLAAIIM